MSDKSHVSSDMSALRYFCPKILISYRDIELYFGNRTYAPPCISNVLDAGENCK